MSFQSGEASNGQLGARIRGGDFSGPSENRGIDHLSVHGERASALRRRIFFCREDTTGPLEFLWVWGESLIEYGYLGWMGRQSSGKAKPPCMRRGFTNSIIV